MPGPATIFHILFGLGLFGAFFLSSLNAYPRYFSPSLIVLAIAVLPLVPRRPAGVAIPVLVILMSVHAAVDFHRGVRHGLRRLRHRPHPSGAMVPAGELRVLPNSLGRQGTREFAEEHGKKLYKPNSGRR